MGKSRKQCNCWIIPGKGTLNYVKVVTIYLSKKAIPKVFTYTNFDFSARTSSGAVPDMLPMKQYYFMLCFESVYMCLQELHGRMKLTKYLVFIKVNINNLEDILLNNEATDFLWEHVDTITVVENISHANICECLHECI